MTAVLCVSLVYAYMFELRAVVCVFCCSLLMMSLNRLQLLMQTELFLDSQRLPLVRQMPILATWHIMAYLQDGQAMQLEGILLAERFTVYYK